MTATKTEQARVMLRTFTCVEDGIDVNTLFPHFRVKASGVIVLPNGDEIPIETTLTEAEMQRLGDVAGRIGQRYLRELAAAIFATGGNIE